MLKTVACLGLLLLVAAIPAHGGTGPASLLDPSGLAIEGDPKSEPCPLALTDAAFVPRMGAIVEQEHTVPDPELHDVPDVALVVPSFEACTGGRIGPGASMTSPAGCTFNFVFSQGSRLFIGTAGHCVGGPGQSVSTHGASGFGQVVFNAWTGPVTTDFALIEIHPSYHSQVNPSVCTWGGPTGVGSPSGVLDQDFLLQYGWGSASFPAAQTRSRIHDEFLSSPNVLSWNGIGSGGDSGSPLLYGDGRAAGIHTAGLTPIAGVVLEQGPTIERVLQLAQDHGYNLQLETAPTRWTVPV